MLGGKSENEIKRRRKRIPFFVVVIVEETGKKYVRKSFGCSGGVDEEKEREREREERGIFLFTIFWGNEVKSSLADFTLMAWHGSGRGVRGKGGREGGGP